MLVALGALNADSKESIGEPDGSLFRLAEIRPAPVVRHGWPVRERGLAICLIDLCHRRAILGIALVRLAARAEDDALDELVIRLVVGDAFINPVVPVLGHTYASTAGSELIHFLVVIPSPIAKACGPPGGIGWRLEK